MVGGINVTESARVAGDDYNTRSILLTEAVATLVAGLCGGVAQSTPYIGQPAYKRMGARAGYTLLTGLFIGLGGMLGYVSFFVELIPRAVLAPILIFVALDIVAESFRGLPAAACAGGRLRLLSHRGAGCSPSDWEIPTSSRPRTLQRLLEAPGKSLPETLVTIALGNGFILTAMLWGAFSCGTDRSPSEVVGDLPADHGGADVFWSDPFRVAGRRDVSAMDAAGRRPRRSRISFRSPTRSCAACPAGLGVHARVARAGRGARDGSTKCRAGPFGPACGPAIKREVRRFAGPRTREPVYLWVVPFFDVADVLAASDVFAAEETVTDSACFCPLVSV